MYSAAWPFRAETSSDPDVPTADMYSASQTQYVITLFLALGGGDTTPDT